VSGVIGEEGDLRALRDGQARDDLGGHEAVLAGRGFERGRFWEKGLGAIGEDEVVSIDDAPAPFFGIEDAQAGGFAEMWGEGPDHRTH
jgi:hypothetical protein